jgi:hypothetical protein
MVERKGRETVPAIKRYSVKTDRRKTEIVEEKEADAADASSRQFNVVRGSLGERLRLLLLKGTKIDHRESPDATGTSACLFWLCWIFNSLRLYPL